MKANEIMKDLFSMSYKPDSECGWDTCKAGDPEAEVEKVAVAMFATIDVIKQAKEWGAQLLITHEPLYYNADDEHANERIEGEKRRLIEASGLTIYRYHDHPHFSFPDIIAQGTLQEMALCGRVEHTDIVDKVRIHLEQPMTAIELAVLLEKRLYIKHLRICGARNLPSRHISLMCGTPGGVFDELKSDECQILLTGEACEWSLGEYARDAAQLGHNKTLIVMGHVGSERQGMKYTAELIKNMYTELAVRYFECGEVYSYTDSY